MIDAATGLARALSRGTSRQAVSDLTAEQLLEQLSHEQRADLTARFYPRSSGALAGAAGSPKAGKGSAPHAARLAADPEFAKGFREGNARAVEVLRHPAAQGRKSAVAVLLKSDMTAAEIIATLEGRASSTSSAAGSNAASSSWSRSVARANELFAGAR